MTAKIKSEHVLIHVVGSCLFKNFCGYLVFRRKGRQENKNISSQSVRVNTACNSKEKSSYCSYASKIQHYQKKTFYKSFLFLYFMNQKGHKPNLKKHALQARRVKC